MLVQPREVWRGEECVSGDFEMCVRNDDKGSACKEKFEGSELGGDESMTGERGKWRVRY